MGQSMRDIFEADTSRRSFTRLNDSPIPAVAGPTMSAAVKIPRGSREIHLYLVLGVSAGQVESSWPEPGQPNVRKRPIAYAAPQIAAPSRPVLEAQRVLDKSADPPTYRAALRVQTRPGATVSRVDIHRVRVVEASLSIDTMGPPLATVNGSGGGWRAVSGNCDRLFPLALPLGLVSDLAFFHLYVLVLSLRVLLVVMQHKSSVGPSASTRSRTLSPAETRTYSQALLRNSVSL
jgi:hypothetical protein